MVRNFRRRPGPTWTASRSLQERGFRCLVSVPPASRRSCWADCMSAKSEDLKIPRHIAIIMDGNGRWAKERGLPRTEGHRLGADSVETIVEACGEMGVEFLTLY